VARSLIDVMLELESVYSAASRQLGLTAQQAQLLCAVTESVSVGELATSLHCDRSNVTRLLDRMDGKNLLTRTPDDQDRRVTRISLTAQGEERVARIKSGVEDRLTALLSGWPASRTAAALEVLEHLGRDLRGAQPAVH
jgi:DNA-binding MarR family transcriptional regulator